MLTLLQRHRYALAFIGAAASWGLATVIAKSALSTIPPFVLLPVQLAASILLITPSYWSGTGRNPAKSLPRLVGLGILTPESPTPSASSASSTSQQAKRSSCGRPSRS